MKRTRLPNLSGDDGFSASRAALYMRVSTGRQAEHDLSIPDQRSQLRSWCRAKGLDVVAEFVEAGASAGDDRRAVFQQDDRTRLRRRACLRAPRGPQLQSLLPRECFKKF